MSKDSIYSDRPLIIRDILRQSAALYGDMIAYKFKGDKNGEYRSKTYAGAFDDINALGAAMTELGLKGKKIALLGENCYPWIITYLTGAAGGIVSVPLGTQLGEAAIKNLVGIADCAAIFYTEGFDEIIDGIDVPLKIRMNRYADADNPEGVLTWNKLLADGRALPAEKIIQFKTQEIDPEALSVLMFTSGTTGAAKGAMLTTRHLAHAVWDMEQAHNIHPGDVTVSILPIYHIFEAIMGQLFMLGHGATIAFGDGIKYLKKNMTEVGVTVQLLVPLLVENFYKTVWRSAKREGREDELNNRIKEFQRIRKELEARNGRNDDSEARSIARDMFKEEQAEFGGKLDSIFTGAAAIDPKYIRGLQDIGIKITQGYGMTEAGPLVSTTPYFSDTYGTAGSVGPVTPSGEIQISDPDDDGVGEVMYRSPSLMKGYLNMPEQSAKVLKDGWYYTGDFGFLDEKGWLYITGRKNNIIVTKTGKNIFPEEIEADL
ncbi:MAG: AMP-binding protein, partial [Clostridiales Family XIII bacterium]|nr:AMP-binding protein [Clostridiales Family XIII bacterium]